MLSHIPGERIRRQYFNIPIYLLLIFTIPFICLFAAGGNSEQTVESETALYFATSLIILDIHLLIPLLLLSVLNRFLFGKVICVLNNKGLYYFDNKICFISWADIKEVTYCPTMPELRVYLPTYNSLRITTQPYKKKVTIEIEKAPFHLLLKMKKYHSHATYRLKKFWIIFALLFVLVTSVAGPLITLFG